MVMQEHMHNMSPHGQAATKQESGCGVECPTQSTTAHNAGAHSPAVKYTAHTNTPLNEKLLLGLQGPS
jgi:hypothetical protein